jgi:hypothetical protein
MRHSYAASQTRDPGNICDAVGTGAPDQQRNTPQWRRAAPHPGHDQQKQKCPAEPGILR